MKINLLCIGDKPPYWLQTGIAVYQKRLAAYLNFNILSFKSVKGANTQQKEGELLISKSKNADLIIALDECGQTHSSIELSQHLKEWRGWGLSVCLLIGGADGLSKNCLDSTNQKWSLSKLTLPHMFVRLIMIEQLYRAQSLLNQHPYHKI